ncbi:MAG: hypothetical protein VYD93_12035, partial [Actinomycetota bacterium]|nr:hypothetical protein [Actinomycetota bacterium]
PPELVSPHQLPGFLRLSLAFQIPGFDLLAGQESRWCFPTRRNYLKSSQAQAVHSGASIVSLLLFSANWQPKGMAEVDHLSTLCIA